MQENKKIWKEEKGVTMVMLVITIILMLIMTVTVSVNLNRGFVVGRRNNFKNDIEVLTDRINIYYSKNGQLPVYKTYTGDTTNFKKDNRDNDTYYIVDTRVLDNLTLNFGAGLFELIAGRNSDDIFIVNEQSHTVYYVPGIDVDGVMYYTIY